MPRGSVRHIYLSNGTIITRHELFDVVVGLQLCGLLTALSPISLIKLYKYYYSIIIIFQITINIIIIIIIIIIIVIIIISCFVCWLISYLCTY